MKKEYIPEGMTTILEAVEQIASHLASEHEESDIEARDRVVLWIQNECSRRLTAYLLPDGGRPGKISHLEFANTMNIEEMCRTGTHTISVPMSIHSNQTGAVILPIPTALYESISGRVLFKRADLDRLLSADVEATSDSSNSPSDVEEGRYCPPYIAFMLQGVEALQLSADERAEVETIKGWIKENWPESFGRLSDNLIRNMVTMMRRPSDAKGGNTLWKKRQ